MKVQRTAEQHLEDVVTWGERAMRHTAGLTRDQFLTDERAQDAVTTCILNVGEAANKAVRLDPAIAEENPDFEAGKAYAARNVLAHDYFRIDPSVLWATVEKSIPAFVATKRILLQRKARD